MSPLITRTVSPKLTDHTMRKTRATFYVSPDDVQPGDVVVEPSEKQLAELREQYPDEYPEPEEELEEEEPGKDSPPSSSPPALSAEELTELAVQFVEMDWQKAVAAVEQEKEAEVLEVLFAAEQIRDRPRDSVLKAFAARGLFAPPPAE